MKTTRLRESALRYAQQGFKIFPCYGVTDGACDCGNAACKSPGKHPRTRNGVSAATTDEDQIVSWWERWPTANIGMATGEEQGIFVVDIDKRTGPDGGGKDGTLWLDAMGAELPQAPQAITPSGGLHLVYRYPEGRHVHQSQDQIHRGVDVRSNGGYIVVEPSRGGNGVEYMWEDDPRDFSPPDAPGWLLDIVGAGVERSRGSGAQKWRNSNPLTDEKRAEILDALAYVDSDPRSDWLRVGMAIHAEYANEQGFDLWCEWSQRSPKFDMRMQRKTWDHLDSFGDIQLSTLFWLASDHGWVNPASTFGASGGSVAASIASPAKINGVATGAASVVIDGPPPVGDLWTPEKASDPEIPDHLINVPGFIGELTRWMVRSAYMPIPSLSFGAAIAAASALFGRRYVGSTRLRTNLYVLGIAPSGSGKDDTLRMPRQALIESGWSDIMGGGDISSHVGLVNAMIRNPVRLFLLDEVGQLFSRMSGRGRASSWESAIRDRLLEFYSASKGVFVDREVQGQGEPALIHAPSVTLYGVTTPNVWDSITHSDVTGGLIGRMLVFEAGAEVDDITRINFRPSSVVPSSIKSFLDAEASRAESQYDAAGNLSRTPTGIPPAVLVTETDEAAAEFAGLVGWEFDRRRGLPEHRRAIVVRAAENARKLAMIRALGEPGRRGDGAEISAECARWACDLSRWLVERTLWITGERISVGESARQVDDALALIRSQGADGCTQVSLGQYLHKRHGIKARAVREIVDTLADNGSITIAKEATSGRPRLRYWAVR